MTIYSWGNDSLIQKLQIVPYGKKSQEAVLHATPNAEGGELAAIPEMFRSFGFTVISDTTEQGEHVLHIRGFEKPEDVAKALEQNGFVKEDDRKEEAGPKIKKEKQKFSERMRESSLRTAGVMYLIGDAAMAVAGIKRKDYSELTTGVAYAAASGVLAKYAKKKPEKMFDDLYEKMLADFAEQGVEVPEFDKTSAEDLAKPGGTIEKIEAFLDKNVREVHAGMNVLGGISLAKSGVNQGRPLKTAAGIFNATGMAISLLVPEKRKEEIADGTAAESAWSEPEKEKKGGLLRGIADWVQEAPMRTAGYMSMTNNVLNAASGLQEKKQSDKRREELPGLIEQNREDQAAAQSDFSAASANRDVEGAIDADKKRTLLGAQGTEFSSELERLEDDKNNWMFNMLAGSFYFVANGMYSLSSKGGNGNKEDDPVLEELYTASAELLAAQPEEVRGPIMQRVAFHLAENKEISDSPDEIMKKVSEKIEQLQQSPWLARTAQSQAAAQHNPPGRA